MIRIAFHEQIEKVGVSGYIQGACDNAITTFKKLFAQLGGELPKSTASASASLLQHLLPSPLMFRWVFHDSGQVLD
jgi:hypothetical protein